MPIYEFKCLDCQKKFEIICSISTPTSEVACNKCGSRRTQKSISAASYRLSSSSSGGMIGGSGCSNGSGFS